jgi:spore coat protein U-like protein
MFKKLPLLLLGLVMALSNQSYAQSKSSTASVKASAKLSSSCLMSSASVNFGQISLPVSNQSATSSITVQCTKGSAYIIGLAYGGVYGVGANPVQHVYININGTVDEQQSGGGFAVCNCTIPANAVNEGPVWNGLNYTGYSNIYVAQVPTTFYSYGKLMGVAHGDSIGYSIQVPNNPAQVWNTGNYSYNASGLGINQTIPVIATLIPAQTSSKYPAADSYLDTVTATISY